MKLKFALLAAAGSLALGSAAQAGDGWYTAVGAGYTMSGDNSDFESPTAAPAPFDSEFELEKALNLYGALGFNLDAGYRIEAEVATREQDIEGAPGPSDGFGGFLTDGSIGDVKASTLMVNLYKDFNLEGTTRPYLGVGAGLARVNTDLDNTRLGSAAVVGTDPYIGDIDQSDTGLAFQAMAGLVFELTDMVDLDFRYRFLAADDIEVSGSLNGTDAAFESGYRANELSAGLRWNFGAAAPAPKQAVEYKSCWDGSRVMATVECPPEIVETIEAPEDISLTVYFDYDKSNLTDAAQDVIREKSAEALEYDISSVLVAGNTDTSGSSAYNNALSSRRANVVQDALVANGVAGDLISTQANGENSLQKETADGVREPLNRRTDVEFKF